MQSQGVSGPRRAAFLHVAKIGIQGKGERNSMVGDLTEKLEVNYLILVYHTWRTCDLIAMMVLVRPYRVKEGTDEVSLNIYPRMLTRHCSFDCKNVALFDLGGRGGGTCGSHKHPMLISLLCLPRCLMLNSFHTETREPELQ